MVLEKVESQVINCKRCGTILTTKNWQPCRQKVNYKVCAFCMNLKSDLWKKNNPDKVKAQKSKWVSENKDKVKEHSKRVSTQSRRKHVVKLYYGLSWEEYENLYLTSQGACSICSKPLSLLKEEHKETAHVDHCHTTGKIRGILCRSCNRGIGYLNDSPERLHKAAEYLTKHGNN